MLAVEQPRAAAALLMAPFSRKMPADSREVMT